jgi:signal transduction histidine kinase
MDSATRDRIFEPFFSTKGLTGTGLGLWVSQEIAIKYHGRIRLRSRQQSAGAGGGTVFRFFLPAGAEEQPA